ncbi:hypothetical protein [Methylobacterium sp. A54F]
MSIRPNTRRALARSVLPIVLLAAPALWQPALAQGPAQPDQTGTGGGPTSTITAPNTNTLGVTKPPGTSLGAPAEGQRQVEQRVFSSDRKIERSICSGC